MIKKTVILLGIVVTGILLSGCTANLTDPEIDFEPPVYVEQMPALEDQQDFVSTGSIFGQGDNPLFSDHKAMHVNDIVRVEISETANSTNIAQKNLQKADITGLSAGVFTPGVNAGTVGGASSGASSVANAINGITNTSFAAGTTNTFTGAGQALQNASFTTTVSARIVKVLSNGNYFISGSREILIDKQKQIIKISGVIRPYDIDQTNRINSNQMSDAKILYETQGDIGRSAEQGWGTKLVQSVWPF